MVLFLFLLFLSKFQALVDTRHIGIKCRSCVMDTIQQKNVWKTMHVIDVMHATFMPLKLFASSSGYIWMIVRKNRNISFAFSKFFWIGFFHFYFSKGFHSIWIWIKENSNLNGQSVECTSAWRRHCVFLEKFGFLYFIIDISIILSAINVIYTFLFVNEFNALFVYIDCWNYYCRQLIDAFNCLGNHF